MDEALQCNVAAPFIQFWHLTSSKSVWPTQIFFCTTNIQLCRMTHSYMLILTDAVQTTLSRQTSRKQHNETYCRQQIYSCTDCYVGRSLEMERYVDKIENFSRSSLCLGPVNFAQMYQLLMLKTGWSFEYWFGTNFSLSPKFHKKFENRQFVRGWLVGI